MLSYNRIGVSERIDINKTSKSKECSICGIFRGTVSPSTIFMQWLIYEILTFGDIEIEKN